MPKAVKKITILDTSAFVAGLDPSSLSEEQYITPAVEKEISSGSMAWLRVKTSAESGKLRVRAPRKFFIDKAKEAATLVGDISLLSEADFQVLALALELKTQGYSPVIATDDYSIQNVADQMNIKFASLATFGIRFRLQWKRYCPGCHKKYPSDFKSNRCEVCGSELKRKPLRKKMINRRNPGENGKE